MKPVSRVMVLHALRRRARLAKITVTWKNPWDEKTRVAETGSVTDEWGSSGRDQLGSRAPSSAHARCLPLVPHDRGWVRLPLGDQWFGVDDRANTGR